jgi:hypothetical protein
MTQFEKFIKTSIAQTIRKIKGKGTIQIGLDNLMQITPTPPREMANDENVANYSEVFRRIALRYFKKAILLE